MPLKMYAPYHIYHQGANILPSPQLLTTLYPVTPAPHIKSYKRRLRVCFILFWFI